MATLSQSDRLMLLEMHQKSLVTIVLLFLLFRL